MEETRQTCSVDGMYRFVEKNNTEAVGILITKGPYEGLIYNYNHCSFTPPKEEGGEVHVHFDYDILERPLDLKEESLETVEFTNLLGDILVDIVDKSLSQYDEVLRETKKPTNEENETRNSDPKESSL